MYRMVKRAPWWMVAATALATIAAACTSSVPSTAPSAAASTASSNAPATSAPAASAAAASAAPASASAEASAAASTAPSSAAGGGGIVSIGSQGDIQFFDPALAYDTVSWTATRLLFDQLVEYDATSTKLVPGLAKEMPTVSADGLTYTFHLRSGVKFYKGDGSVLREMNADDVVASLNRILDQGLKPNPSPVGPAFFSIIAGSAEVLAGTAKTASGIKATDPMTVDITLTKPDKRLPYILAMMFGSVIPADSPADATEFAKAPIGTGPYHLVEYKQGQIARFERNADYWGAAPANAGVELRIGLDANTQLQQAEANQLDLMSDPIPGGSYTATVNDPTYKDRLLRRTDVALFYMTMDTSGPDKALANVKVRQAINHAIDKANLVRIQNGRGGPSTCILPPPMPGYDASCDPYPHDIEKAKALMKEAGFEAGFKTTLYTYTDDTVKAQTEAIQQDLAQIGITVDIVQQEFSVLLGHDPDATPGADGLHRLVPGLPRPVGLHRPDPVMRHGREGWCQQRLVLQQGDRCGVGGRARRAGRRNSSRHVPGHPEEDHGRRAVGTHRALRDGDHVLESGRRYEPAASGLSGRRAGRHHQTVTSSPSGASPDVRPSWAASGSSWSP